MWNKFRLQWVCVLVLALLLTACGGNRGGDAATDEAGDQPAATEPATAEDAVADGEEPAADDAASDEAPADTAASSGADSVALISIGDSDAIQSFRMRFTMSGTQSGEAQEVSVEGEFVKEPPAERLSVEMAGGPVAGQSIETIVVDGTRYTRLRDRWIQTPGEQFSLDDITPLTPDEFTGDAQHLENLGEETLNGRQVTHYQLTKENIPTINLDLGGQQRELSALENAQLDLWVDQELNFIMKMAASVEDAQSNSQFEMIYEYYDINADISIEAP